MDLYIAPMSCSLAAHIACLEAGLAPTLHRVDRTSKTLDDGRDYRTIAPQVNVPVIALREGGILSESTAVLQYIADLAPASQLAPAPAALERYRLQEWLGFTTTELHKKLLWMVFSSKTTPELKAWARANATDTLDHIARHLAAHDYLVGDRFTVADAYMFWALLVAPHGGISLDAHPALSAYVARIQRRQSVKAALAHDYPLYAKEAAAGNAPRSAISSPARS
ncbi:MAG: glutathione S-transferase family protein [Deltaproteobacteria bacterium]|nr:glutathione S-transferase family protein [Deltaproteobacteria bacterium]